MKSSARCLCCCRLRSGHRTARRCPATATSFRAIISIIPSSRPSGGITPAICATADGRRFGFELTFFRQGVDRSAETRRRLGCARRLARPSRPERYRRRPLLSRRAPQPLRPGTGRGVARPGARLERQLASRSGTSAPARSRCRRSIRASRSQLDLRPLKPPVIHGVNGVSQKAAGAGHASHYISFTRLETRGPDRAGGPDVSRWRACPGWTTSSSPTSSPTPERLGLVQPAVRRRHGTDALPSAPQGRHRRSLFRRDLRGCGQAAPPTSDAMRFPSLPASSGTGIRSSGPSACRRSGSTSNSPPGCPQQELETKQSRYWEGAIEINGSRRGSGYLEMTGYAGAVRP